MVTDATEPKTLPPGGAGEAQVVEAKAVERPDNEAQAPSDEGKGQVVEAQVVVVPSKAGAAPSGELKPQVSKDGAAPSDAPVLESKAEQIRKLLDRGYSVTQVEKDFGFHPSTIQKEQEKRVQPAGTSVPAAKASQSQPEMMKLARYEIIPPEQALAGIRLQDGEYKLGFTDGIRMLLLAVRYTQELATLQANMMDPTIKMITAMREEERIAIEKTDRSAAATAERVAEQMSDRVVSHFEDRLARIEAKTAARPSSGNPMMDMMARVMEPLISNVMGSLMPGMTPKGQDGQPQVQGFTYKTVQEAPNAS